MIGLVHVTDAGARGAARLAAAWPGRTRAYDGPVSRTLAQAFAECDQVVAFAAAGVVVRLVAPLLVLDPAEGVPDRRAKGSTPGVVCVDEAHRFAVPLLGGHGGGANALADEVAQVLGARPVVTTGTDAAGVPGLDDLGLPCEGDVAGVSRAMLDGRPVRLVVEHPCPLPALPDNVSSEAPEHSPTVLVTDRAVPARDGLVVLHPRSLVLGVGASSGADPREMADLAAAALASAGLSAHAVREVVTADVKAFEPAVTALARDLGVPLRTVGAARLAEVPVPHPSETVRAAVGTPSVAEASVLVRGAALVVPKQVASASTVAVGRLAPRGRLAVVGIGPGARDLMTPRALAELRRASAVVGLDQYVDQVRELLRPGTEVVTSGMGSEEYRVWAALEIAQAGRSVALIGSGDAGVYAMGSPVLECLGESLEKGGPTVDVVGVPGVSAAVAASALLGAPFGHDHAYISLSDLHTPWAEIEKRLHAAAAGDFTVALYNPRSRGRTEHLPLALEILGAHRPPTTPVGVVRNATRADERITLTTLAEIDVRIVDMMTVVLVGCSVTRVVDGHMVTPRGYTWLEEKR